MGKHSIVGMVQIAGISAFTAVLAACGDASSGEEPQGTLTRTDIEATTDGLSMTPRSKVGAYRVVIIDPVRVTHQPSAINNRGQIAGSAQNDEDVRQAWYWDGEEGHFLRGDDPEGSGDAADINDAGHVVGGTTFLRTDEFGESPRYRTRAFLYDGTTMTAFGVLGGNNLSRALGVNRHGDVAGTSYGGTGEQHAVLFQDYGVIDFGRGRAHAVNDHGEVTGQLSVGSEDVSAFLYSGGEIQILGTLGGDRSTGNDINNAGAVVGSSTTASGVVRAFLYRGGEMVELPVPGEGSSAAAINRSGQIVGTTTIGTPQASESFLYRNGEAALLRDILPQDGCWKSLEARDINDHGDIVGVGVMNDGASCGEVGRYLVVVTRSPKRYQR
jgi:probable HAF family extracellular repeat protein